VNKPKRASDIPVYVYNSPAEQEQLQARMAEAGTNNMGSFIRKRRSMGTSCMLTSPR
jgi:hypothetical protein